MVHPERALGRRVFTIAGAAAAGAAGVLVGSLVGGFSSYLLPPIALLVSEFARTITRETVTGAASGLAERLAPEERQRINHDLQMALRDAFREALFDIGGKRCFPQAWRARRRDVPERVVYPSTPEADRLWRDADPLAGQVSSLFEALERALDSQELLPLDPPADLPAADVRAYLEAETPLALSDAFFGHVVSPHLAGYGTLFVELPRLRDHLRDHLLDRTLVHLSEFLKQRDPAWRAFNRLMLDGLREQIGEVQSGQAELVRRLDSLLSAAPSDALGQWSDGMAELLSATGRIEKDLAEGLDTVISRVLEQQSEVTQRLDALWLVGTRIEAKVDRVLRILENGRFVIEGQPSVPIDEPPAPGSPPYKGLQHFAEGDADLFYGRELLVARLVGQIRHGGNLVIVVGASGSGKSSVVRAGLIPALRRGERLADGSLPPQGSTSWPVHVLTPTAHPLLALAACLTRSTRSTEPARALVQDMARDPLSLDLHVRRLLSTPTKRSRRKALEGFPAAGRLLLVVDQFEEAFTLCHDAEERQAFVGNLLAAAGLSPDAAGDRRSREPTLVLVALRADFYPHCSEFAGLRSALETSQVYIGPMQAEELKSAVEEPARRRGWEFERGLVDLILRDTGNEPGALPLLSHALLETWRRRRGRVMTLESYAEAGGVRTAIATTAESVLRGLTPSQQEIARSVFLRLTDLGEGTQDTRRRVDLEELIAQPEARGEVLEVVGALADARLVTTSEDPDPDVVQVTVEVAHEALIREWPTLRGWLDEDREGLRVHRRMTEAAAEWARLERDDGLLYRGVRLAEACDWARLHATDVNPQERAFLAESVALSEREAAAAEAQRQRELEAARQLAEAETARAEAERRRAEDQARTAARLRRRAMFLGSALAAAVLFLVLAGIAARIAFRQSDLAAERRDAALTAEAAALSEGQRADLERLSALAAQATAVAEGRRADQERDGAVAAEATAQAERQRAEAQALVASSRQLAAEALSHTDDQLDLALLLSVEAGRLSDTANARGSLLAALQSEPRLRAFLRGHDNRVERVAFSPSGDLLATGDASGLVFLWDVARAERRNPALASHSSPVSSLAFSPGSEVLAVGSSDGTIVLWDVPSGQEMGRLPGHSTTVSSLAFGPLGAWLVSGSHDATIRFWDATELQPIAEPLPGHTNWITQLAVCRDGTHLASAGYDGEVLLWDLAAAQVPVQLTGTTSLVFSLAFSPDGSRLAGGCDDGGIVLWDAATAETWGSPLRGHAEAVHSLAFGPDGRSLVSADRGGTILTWDLNTRQATGSGLKPMRGHSAAMLSMALAPDGRTVATGGADGAALLWDLGAEHRLATFLGEPPGSLITHVAYSADGSLLAAGAADGTIVLYDTATGQRLGVPLAGHAQWVTGLAFHPDGEYLASSGYEGTVRFWDLSTRRLSGQPLDLGSPVNSLALDPQGDTLACGGQQGQIVLWDTSSQKRLGEPLGGFGAPVNALAFSPDGALLAAEAGGYNLVLWDLETRRPAGQQLLGHGWTISDLAFSPSGDVLASASYDKTVILWDVRRALEPEALVGQLLGQRLAGHRDLVTGLAFDPQGNLLASSSSDGTVILWDVGSGQSLGQPLTGATGGLNGVGFSPDGAVLATAGADWRIWLWEMRLGSWRSLACAVAGRNLTAAEWGVYRGDEPYSSTCEGLPVHASAIVTWARQADGLHLAGRQGEASALLEQAAQAVLETTDAGASNLICWYGNVDGLSDLVLPVCDQAVSLAPAVYVAAFRQNRGVARGVTGDTPGAIEDLEAFVVWTRQSGQYETYGRLREAWVADLKAGRDPFDAGTLEALRNE